MAGGSRPHAGRRTIKINPGEMEKLCALQCTDRELAAWFDVSVRTIERRRKRPAFAEAMENGKAKGRLSLRRSLWGLAAKGNPAANIFLAKNLLGYTDLLRNEHSGPDGGPIHVAVDLSALSIEELEQLNVMSLKVEAASAAKKASPWPGNTKPRPTDR